MTTIIKPITAYFIFTAAPLLALILANLLFEPGRVWFTGASQAQELAVWAAMAAWAFLSLRLFILPLERKTS